MNFFCSKDCPDLCGIDAELKNGEYKFKGKPEEWVKNGFVCSKFSVFAKREINNGIKPYLVEHGKKKDLSIEDAVDEFAALVKNSKKILYMRGSGSLAYNMCYWDVLLSQMPNVWCTSGGPCDETGCDAHEADFDTVLNPPVSNMENADTIILYGKDAAMSSQHFYAYLTTLKKIGKKIIYISPIFTKTAELADRYIQIKLGFDGVLAAAILSKLGLESFDNEELVAKTGVPKADFDFLCETISNEKCAHVEGFGIQRNSNGMNSFQWINRLAVKTGAQDMLYFGHSSKKRWVKQMKSPFAGQVHVDKIAKSLAEGEFDLYINIAANPAMTYPDTNLWLAGIKNTKTIVVDVTHTETSANADLFINVGGMFAQADFMGSYFFPQHYSREKLTNELGDTELVKMIGEKLGIEINVKDVSEVETVETPQRAYKTDKLELTIPEAGDKFQLLTSSSSKYLNSQILPGMEKGMQIVYINPADAEKFGIKTGEDIRITGEGGYFVAEAFVTDKVGEKLLMCWKSIPMKEGFSNSAIVNKTTDSGNGLVYYSQHVEVSK